MPPALRLLRPVSTLGAPHRGAPGVMAKVKEYEPIVNIDEHAARAWEFFRSIGSPKYHVAPMVDQSELPFRMLCRQHGATCAYTPMIHSRLFVDDKAYRREIFTTCPEDRPLFVQFCANSPDYLRRAAELVQDRCDAVDLNLGCPQRIARRGNYGAFLMDTPDVVRDLVATLHQNLKVPVTCKIRKFDDPQDTLRYARMLQGAGCYVLAVHGRTREQKNASEVRADWDIIKAVKAELKIPVLANGNMRTLQDVLECMQYTGADGVLSADPLLEDPALFSPARPADYEYRYVEREAPQLAVQYLQLCQKYTVPNRMIKGHLHKITGRWLAEHVDLRDRLNREINLGLDGLLELMRELERRVSACGRTYAIPTVTAKQLKQAECDAARAAAIEEQEREAMMLAALGEATAEPQAVASGAAPAAPPAAHAATAAVAVVAAGAAEPSAPAAAAV